MKKTLTQAKKGEACKIIDFADSATKCQTMRFGLCSGEVVRCIAKAGPVIIGKNQQTLAIGNNLARKIYIQTAGV